MPLQNHSDSYFDARIAHGAVALTIQEYSTGLLNLGWVGTLGTVKTVLSL